MNIITKFENVLYEFVFTSRRSMAKSQKLEDVAVETTSTYSINCCCVAENRSEVILDELGEKSNALQCQRNLNHHIEHSAVKYMQLNVYNGEMKNLQKVHDGFLRIVEQRGEQFPLLNFVCAKLYMEQNGFFKDEEYINKGLKRLYEMNKDETIKLTCASVDFNLPENNPQKLQCMFEMMKEYCESKQVSNTFVKKAIQPLGGSITVSNNIFELRQSERHITDEFLNKESGTINDELISDVTNKTLRVPQQENLTDHVDLSHINMESISQQNHAGSQTHNVIIIEKSTMSSVGTQTDDITIKEQSTKPCEAMDENLIMKSMLVENRGLQKKIEGLKTKLDLCYKEILAFKYKGHITSNQKINNREIALKKQLEELQAKFKNLESYYHEEIRKNHSLHSIMTMFFTRYSSANLNFITNHIDRCNRMISEIESISIHLSSANIAEIEDCVLYTKIWNKELQNGKTYLNLFQDYCKTIYCQLFTKNLEALSTIPEFVVQLSEPRLFWLDKVIVTIASLKQQYKLFNQNADSQWNSGKPRPGLSSKNAPAPMNLQNVSNKVNICAESTTPKENPAPLNMRLSNKPIFNPSQVVCSKRNPTTYATDNGYKKFTRTLPVYKRRSSTENLDKHDSPFIATVNKPAQNELLNNGIGSEQLSGILNRNSVLYPAIKEVAGHKFFNLYMHVKNQILDIDQDTLLSTLSNVCTKYDKIDLEQKDKIVSDVQDEINKFKRKEEYKQKSSSDNKKQTMECMICLKPLLRLSTRADFNCEHIFHIGCVKERFGKKHNCPICPASKKAFY